MTDMTKHHLAPSGPLHRTKGAAILLVDRLQLHRDIGATQKDDKGNHMHSTGYSSDSAQKRQRRGQGFIQRPFHRMLFPKADELQSYYQVKLTLKSTEYHMMRTAKALL